MFLKFFDEDPVAYKTRLAYTWTGIFNAPFFSLFALLPFILCKDLNANAWQIAAIFSSKPIASLFSFYWSERIRSRPDRLLSNIVWARILGHLPFFFIPLVDNPWYFVFSSAVYMFFYRGANPAWMEIIKLNASEDHRKHVVAFGSAFSHVSSAILAILFGLLLDDFFHAWRWLFPVTACCSILGLITMTTIPKENLKNIFANLPTPTLSEHVKKPWREVWNLLNRRPDFFRFQEGFMLAGGGLMLWQPALPLFFFETLHLNYIELSVAITLCKSIGYVFAIPFWIRILGGSNFFIVSGLVFMIATFFPLGLLAAQWNLIALYLAYCLYGFMQAGSELSWNMSGPIFSKHEDSSSYTSVNILTAGIRGCIAPPLGSFLSFAIHPSFVLMLGGGFCLFASWKMLFYKTQEDLTPIDTIEDSLIKQS